MEDITLSRLLKRAAQKETAAWLLYNNLSRRALQASLRDCLREIVRQEKEHQALLEEYLEGRISEGTLSLDLVVAPEVVACLEQPSIFPEMNPVDMLALAVKREQATHDLYLSLAQLHPEGSIKSRLEEMARQELEHKSQLELNAEELITLPD